MCIPMDIHHHRELCIRLNTSRTSDHQIEAFELIIFLLNDQPTRLGQFERDTTEDIFNQRNWRLWACRSVGMPIRSALKERFEKFEEATASAYPCFVAS